MCHPQVTHLRTKARLLVPDGATLVGVLDEFNVLREGEVFVQVGPRLPLLRLWSCTVSNDVSGTSWRPQAAALLWQIWLSDWIRPLVATSY